MAISLQARPWPTSSRLDCYVARASPTLRWPFWRRLASKLGMPPLSQGWHPTLPAGGARGRQHWPLRRKSPA